MKKLQWTLLTLALATGSVFAMGDRPPAGEPNPDTEEGRWQKLLRDNGGQVVNAFDYDFSPSGFHRYLRHSGVSLFDGSDLTEAHNESAARACGLSVLLPTQDLWIRGAALALWAQVVSSRAGQTPYMRNWYRPSCYNERVGGASRSDHLQARAVDFDFDSSSARRRGQDYLCSDWRSSLNMQIGLGGNSIHLGAQSPHGKRNWYYSSYGDSDKNNTCFDR